MTLVNLSAPRAWQSGLLARHIDRYCDAILDEIGAALKGRRVAG
jgi:hypothetical protein